MPRTRTPPYAAFASALLRCRTPGNMVFRWAGCGGAGATIVGLSWACRSTTKLLVFHSDAGIIGFCGRAVPALCKWRSMMDTHSPAIGPLVQTFFTEHLLHHKRASPQTIASYRDSFRLLLQ